MVTKTAHSGQEAQKEKAKNQQNERGPPAHCALHCKEKERYVSIC